MTADDDDVTKTKTMVINDPVDLDYTDLDHPPKLDLGDHLLIAAKKLSGISQQIKLKINAAKTKPKKDYYTKKLKKNNIILSDILIKLDEFHNMRRAEQSMEDLDVRK